MIDQLRAVAIATRFLVLNSEHQEFEQVWAALREGRWWVSFALPSPPNVAVSPGGVCVTVNAKTGEAAWFETL